MSPDNPVFTEQADCQDCYRCLRECVPKAIRVARGHARIHHDRCVLCGHCVSVCPAGAKRVRDDLGRVQSLLLHTREVYVSLAPSFIAEYPSLSPYRLVAALHRLGFAGVSETALGAQRVSAWEARALRESDASPRIASSCPSVNELVRKYYPGLLPYLSPTFSPALAHAALLRQWYGPDIGVVFIGPCIAKKQEADEYPDLIDAAVTFEDLNRWFEQAGIRPDRMDGDGFDFVPVRAKEGARYPVEGGMLTTLADVDTSHARMAISGLSAVRVALDELSAAPDPGPVLLELLACPGGCINGPMGSGVFGQIAGGQAVHRWTDDSRGSTMQECDLVSEKRIDLTRRFVPAAVPVVRHQEQQIREALARVGKLQASDELNCGSCGYGSCREFAEALLEGRAEQTMCAGHMRKLAQRKSDALLHAMPAGVVMVGADLRIRECNRTFARLLGEEAELLYDACPGLEGLRLDEVAPFWRRFQTALQTGSGGIDQDVRCGERLLSASIFVVEQGEMIGGVFQDITVPSVRRDRVISRAEEVIRRNLSTVQQIAHLLGENAAETEATLSSIIDAFGPAHGQAGE